jgi:phosphate acetyltransferase
MSKSLYITSLEPGSGKSIVALGFMEQLSGRLKSVGVFRPVITGGPEADRFITLMTERYHLTCPAEDLYGVTMEAALSLLAASKHDELYTRILERYKSLESRCDFVLCEGTDYTGVSTALEFDFNVEVARNLGSILVPVINGRGKDPDALGHSTRTLLETLESRKCDVLTVIINRVESDRRERVLAALKQGLAGSRPVYVLPEESLLELPTVRDISRGLRAELISGDDELMDGEVRNVKIAAMELPNLLDHLEEGSLVITPGDRSDIILGTLAADRSGSYPRIGGMVLTGNIKPAPQVQRLIAGLRTSPMPVLGVATDTFTTAMNVSGIRPTLMVENKRKIAAALGIVDSAVDVQGLLERAAVTRSSRVTPLMFQYELIRRAKQQRRHIVLPEGLEERILKAAEIVLLRDVCDITLLGDPEEVRQKASSIGLALDRAKIIDPRTSELLPSFANAYHELRKHKGISPDLARDSMMDVSYFGTMMVHRGLADGMVSGSVHTTAHTIRPALEFVKTKPGISIVSSVFFMCLADRVMVYGDCAIVPEPTAAQLADIAISSASTAAAFGIEPRIAMLSYSTGASGAGPDVDRVREATKFVRDRRPDLKVEGPIQYDAAVDATVAKVKMPDSEVAGHATVFIFPDLSAGNNAYKAVQRAANAIAIGPVLQGLKKPVNDLSRGALVADIVNTIAITAIQAQGQERGDLTTEAQRYKGKKEQ